jgi:ADP-heptose:LPS heptosyltransferase
VSWPPAPTDPPLPIPRGMDLRGASPSRVLVIRLERVGDVLLITPTLRALRARFPNARIELLTRPGNAALLAGNPHVDALIPFVSAARSALDVRAQGYDLVVDLQRATETSTIVAASGAPVRVGRATGKWHDRALSHAVPGQRAYSPHLQASILRVFGVAEVTLDLELVVPPAVADAAITGAPPGPRVTLAPGASSVTRAWPEARWIELATALRRRDLTPVVVWGPPEAELARRIAAASGASLAPPTSLLEMAAWISASELFIGACSAPRHLAVAVGTPTITLHGGSSVGGWTRPTAWHRAVWSDVACRPCNKPDCAIGVVCLTQTEPARVLALVDPLRALGAEPPLTVRILPDGFAAG